MRARKPSLEESLIEVEQLRRELKFEEAQEKLRALLEKEPENWQLWNLSGLIFYDQAKFDEALEAFQRALELAPQNVTIYANLGVVYRKKGNLEASFRALSYAHELDPNSVEVLNNLANVYLDWGEYSKAVELLERACTINPNIPDLYTNLAIIYKNYLNDLTRAEESLQKALNIAPFHPVARRVQAGILTAKGRLDLAEDALRLVLNLNPRDPLVLADLAGILILDPISYPKEAEELLELALKVNFNQPEVHQNFGSLSIILGKKKEALKHFRKALELSPNNVTYLKLYLQHLEPEEIDLSLLGKLLEAEAKERDLHKRIELNYALSAIYEKLGEDDLFFHYLKVANSLKRKTLKYNPKEIEASVRTRKKVFTEALLEKARGYGYFTKMPVFIVGMPRSGTTLLESILDAHPEIYGAGELKLLAETLSDGILIEGILFTSTEEEKKSALISPQGFFEIGRRYYKKLRLLSPNSKRIVDKMPYNFMNLGIILLSLPYAKVLHLQRHPLDTILSCYQQSFAEGNEYTYDLRELAHFYNLYFDLMKHWRTLFSEKLCEIHYEELVSKPREVLERVFDYLEIPFREECLEFYRNEKPVKTASQEQVRKPIYRSSVGRWKRFAPYLKEAIELLDFELKALYKIEEELKGALS